VRIKLTKRKETGVAGGVRTLGHRNHNPALYQLSYSHRVLLQSIMHD
jgi:hypothetical protein